MSNDDEVLKMPTFYLVTGRTESGDEFEYLFEKEMTEVEVDAVICRNMSLEYEEIGFTSWQQAKIEFTDPPTKKDIDRLHECLAECALYNAHWEKKDEDIWRPGEFARGDIKVSSKEIGDIVTDLIGEFSQDYKVVVQGT